MLDTGEDSVSNALRHARANLQKRLSPPGDPHLPRIRGPNEPSSNIWLLRTRLGTLLPWWRCLPKMSSFTAPLADMQFVGPGAAGRLFEAIFAQARSYRLIDTRANGQPAFGVYVRDPATRVFHANGMVVLTLAGDRIRAMTRFDNSVIAKFGLPRRLPG